MKNYFFDILPNDMQYFIYEIVLSKLHTKKLLFYKEKQKKRFIKKMHIILNNEYSKLPNTMEYFKYGGDSYLDPYNKTVSKTSI